MNFKKLTEKLQSELKTYIEGNNIKSLILGISGGIDSALVAALARPVCDELGIKLYGRSITIGNEIDEVERAEKVGKAFCHNFNEVYMAEGVYAGIWSMVKTEGWEIEEPNEKIRQGNVKARLRMIYLYDLAQIHNGMVLSTDNYTEYLLGFWTLHGDVGDYGIIQSMWKTEVYDLAEWIAGKQEFEKTTKALQACIDCQATDGLGITSTDLDQIMPDWTGNSRDGYGEVDVILKIWQMKFQLKTVGETDRVEKYLGHPVIKRHLATEFKRHNPINVERDLIEEFLKTTISKMKALIVVDAQYDFMPGGALAVDGGDEIVPIINDLLPKFDLVIFTKDWHPIDNIYFAASHKGKKEFNDMELNGKMDKLWPIHCVQNTRGADIHDDIDFSLIKGNFYIFKKGDETNCHPYGAFGDRMKDTGLEAFLKDRDVTDLVIVGLATDYCVKDTAIDAVEKGFNVTIVMEGVRSIAEFGDMSTMNEFVKAGVRITHLNMKTKTGVELINDERNEQLNKHNRSIEYDVKNNNHYQLSQAAQFLCWLEEEELPEDLDAICPVEWDEEIWEKMMTKSYKERLIIAGALIAAEIDRIQERLL